MSARSKRILQLVEDVRKYPVENNKNVIEETKIHENHTDGSEEDAGLIETTQGFNVSEIENISSEHNLKADESQISSVPIDRSSSSSSSSTSDSSSSSSSSSSSDSDSENEIEGPLGENKQTSDNDVTGTVNEKNRASDTDISLNRQLRPGVSRINYQISPVNSEESDIDLSDTDPSYNINMTASEKKLLRRVVIPASSSSSSEEDRLPSPMEPKKRGRKRTKDSHKWKQNNARALRNLGKAYVTMSKSKKNMPERSMKPPCSDKCRLKCKEILNEDRLTIFNAFWNLGDLYKQRMFINSCLIDVCPKYKYSNAENPRRANKAFYFIINSQKRRVCKTFFKNTLDISERMIYTTYTKIDGNNFIKDDLRVKHGKHNKVSPELLQDIKEHINSIPRIESHYLRASTSREYIDGGRTITDLYNDFVKLQAIKNKDAGKFCTFYKIFTYDFNIGFFKPKKDQCDECTSFNNSSLEQKELLKEKYDLHHKEKQLSRIEKKLDRKNITATNKVVVFDLQAVLQSPSGETS